MYKLRISDWAGESSQENEINEEQWVIWLAFFTTSLNTIVLKTGLPRDYTIDYMFRVGLH